MSNSHKEQLASTPLFGANAAAVESLYEQFLERPGSVSGAWRNYFESLGDAASEIPHAPIRDQLLQESLQGRKIGLLPGKAASKEASTGEKQAAVSRLIQVYSLRGHQIADIDPLGLMERRVPGVLKLDYLDLEESDMDSEFFTGGLAGSGNERMKLRDILALLRSIYCGKIGVEFAHISRARERLWLRKRFEVGASANTLSDEERLYILERLTSAEGIERYLHTRYVGQKRFSLEGGESLIPALDDIIQQGGKSGIEEIVIGMAHRGRINVLVNILGKSPEELFEEFEGNYDVEELKGSGDVKYHKGFSADLKTPGGNVHLALAFNPSHLEIVNPVVEGSVRARQQRRGDHERQEVLPVLIHGDAAFSGQGVVTETFQMSQVNGFRTGGTIHLVVNNQVGFTTSRPSDARSTDYCSDVAKMIEAPVFHVNGDDPEAVIFVTRLALKYRQKFKKDVVIDLVCYRRHGHNEADEPSATQPIMYGRIKDQKTTRELYANHLVAAGVIGSADIVKLQDDYRDRLDRGEHVQKASLGMIGNKFTADWTPYLNTEWDDAVDTTISPKTVASLGVALTTIPPDIKPHGRVQRIMDQRAKMLAGKTEMDWGFAETMAYASLLADGHNVRLVGQDSGRGTFFHRHAVIHNQLNNREYTPLNHVVDRPDAFRVIDSFLSEEAVLGFEYGFASTDPNTLVIWEGQFGDFANGAQVVIDQFISSGEAKWGRLCGLTMFLPHGYEGQGPEHSSARLERFLQLCAEHNIQVCIPSTPAQMFHMIRRQQVRPYRKPLIVMTPKSLLRHKMSVSAIDELSGGRFECIIPEIEAIEIEKTRRLVFCSGKVYFDLLEARETHGINDIALIRIEQLYPFPVDEYAALVTEYGHVKEIIWCQEEPLNQGAWYQIKHRLQEGLQSHQELYYAGRPSAAAPASGIFKIHLQQQQALVDAALDIKSEASKVVKPVKTKRKSK
ncbi:MAG: 2-oxoglutarate dehydrogenase E1 component [Gammaproteobacteria bacterium]|nr:2-oxoglutarate dehydrogenase E1 component [Gammaproteobacteria bacterium]MDH5240040.1 2-oxoglutarate dehydrogenase E1 component [Gammaproteobacteria bacterium]MDH5260484.1 2-oxoglutarate dehydrogenase E1 component [Gammaproteobacteria bacterium]MDH5582376.1 2-oxoglutarate dehydrogenase E1 component [Gammaproteobacteria bacterium]